MITYKKSLIIKPQIKLYENPETETYQKIGKEYKELRLEELKEILENKKIFLPHEVFSIIINYTSNDIIGLNKYISYCRISGLHHKAIIAQMKYKKVFKYEKDDIPTVFCPCKYNIEFEQSIEDSTWCNLSCCIYYHTFYCLKHLGRCLLCLACLNEDKRWTLCKKSFLEQNAPY